MNTTNPPAPHTLNAWQSLNGALHTLGWSDGGGACEDLICDESEDESHLDYFLMTMDAPAGGSFGDHAFALAQHLQHHGFKTLLEPYTMQFRTSDERGILLHMLAP